MEKPSILSLKQFPLPRDEREAKDNIVGNARMRVKKKMTEITRIHSLWFTCLWAMVSFDKNKTVVRVTNNKLSI